MPTADTSRDQLSQLATPVDRVVGTPASPFGAPAIPVPIALGDEAHIALDRPLHRHVVGAPGACASGDVALAAAREAR